MDSSPPPSLRAGQRRFITFPSTNMPTHTDDFLDSSNSDSSTSPEPNTQTIPLTALSNTGSKSLSGISLRSFLLGTTLSTTTLAALYILTHTTLPLWRSSTFLALLCIFHFLEYYVTAAYNPRQADIAAFLLSTNGAAYAAAHFSALVESVIIGVFAPGWQRWCSNPYTISLAVVLVVAGQGLRSAAMAQAGVSFNHTIQTRRAASHVLVTHGVYSVLRHPSYCGFFWWALGTQLLCGNAVCFVGYVFVLWRFFNHRIRREEGLLMEFFGEVYGGYRRRTVVGIPFIK